MKANELMIGDWVMPDQCQVPTAYTSVAMITMDGVYMDEAVRLFTFEELHPIPLTEEILGRNFPTADEGLTWWPNDRPYYHIECSPLNGTRIIMPYTQYVHELQHALRLCGIEKEIIL